MLRHVCLVCKDIQVNILDKHVCFATLSAVLVVIGQKISLLAIKNTARIFTFATRFPKIESDVNVIITFSPGSADG